jgi:hypothetical protein
MKKFLFFLSILVLVFTPLAHAKVQSARLAVDVTAGQWKSVRLKNLPRDSAVKVEIKSNSAILVSLVDEVQYKKYPDIHRPLFQSKVSDKLTFTVKIPAAGHYYLVFDNVSGTRDANLDVTIQGASGADATLLKGNLSREQEEAFERTLGQIGTELNKLFIFRPFSISVELCGKDIAFSRKDGIVLCLEFVKKISTTLGSKEKTINVLLFTIFHEAGHILLAQWEYPFYDNEEVADDFATVLIMMLGQKERLSAMTEFFISNPSSNELLSQAFKGDRHPLSIQRARNILRWMKDPEQLKKWQTVFVPHMQTAVLKQLKKTTPSWVNPILVEKELAMRKRFR